MFQLFFPYTLTFKNPQDSSSNEDLIMTSHFPCHFPPWPHTFEETQ